MRPTELSPTRGWVFRQRQSTRAWIGVARRNWAAVRTRLAEVMVTLIVEPMIYFVILGYGLGHWIKLEQNQSYYDFLFPSVFTLAAALASFNEAGLMSWHRLHTHHAFQVMKLTSLREEDIALGEWIWATLKGSAVGLILILTGTVFGLLHSWTALFAIPLVLVGAALSSGAGLWVASVTESPSRFSWIYSVFVIPMLLVSETIVPVSLSWVPYQYGLWLSPVYHLIKSVRAFWEARLDWNVLGHLAIVSGVTTIVVFFSIRKFADSLRKNLRKTAQENQ